MWDDGTTGKRNSSLGFDGTNDYVGITDSTVFNLDPTKDYTWSAWLKSDDLTSMQTVWSQYEDANNYFHLYSGTYNNPNWGPLDDGIVVGWENNGYETVIHTTADVLTTTRYYFVTVTYDHTLSQGNRLKIYIDGIDKTDTSDIQSNGTITTISPTTISIGANTGYGEYYSGQIDEVKIWNYALTTQQIKEVYNDGAVRFGP